MSRWTHNICIVRWNKKNPDREPVRLRLSSLPSRIKVCCFCGQPNSNGIFVREDPSTLPCQGVHEENQE